MSLQPIPLQTLVILVLKDTEVVFWMAISEMLLTLVYTDVTEGQLFFVHVGEVSVPVSVWSVT